MRTAGDPLVNLIQLRTAAEQSATNFSQWFHIAALILQLSKTILGVNGMKGWRQCGFDRDER